MQVYQSVQMNECTWGRKVQKLKVWEVGSNKFRHFQSPFVWGTS